MACRAWAAAASAALSCAGLLSYFLQGTGFSYHKVPVVTFGSIALFFVMLETRFRDVPAVFAAVVCLALAAMGVQQGFYRNQAVEEIVRISRDIGPVDGFMSISSHVYTGPPIALALKTTWASSYPANWLVPGAVNRLARTDCALQVETCARLQGILQLNRAANITNIARARPGLVIVDRNSGSFDQPGFDWLAFLDQDPAWAPVFAEYDQVAQTGRFTFFQRRP